MKGAGRFFIASLLFLLSSVSLAQNDEAEKKDEPSYPRLKLGGQFQLQLDDGDLKASSRRPVRNGIGFRPTDSRVDIRRLRLYATAYFSDQVSIVTETDFEAEDLEPDEVTLTPLDFYLKYQFAEGHHLRIGQAKIPFGHEFLKTSRHLTVIERSDVSRMFFQRDIGVGLFGKRERMEYAFGVYQGQGENVAERNGANDIAGKFEYQVTPGLRLGASGHLGVYRSERDLPDVPLRRLGFEAHYQDGPWTFEGEYILGNGYNLFSNADTPSRGFYLYNVIQVRPPLDLVIGYDRFDPDVGSVNLSRSDSSANERDRFTLGLNYYLKRKPVHRFMVNYEFRNELEGPSVSSQGFRLRYQYVW